MKTKLHTKPHEAGGWRLFPLLAWIVLGLTWLVSSQDLAAQPTINLQPQGVSVSIGATVTNQVTASGSGGTLRYQWYFNSTAVPDATNRTLLLTNIQVSQGGDYHVVVTDNGGSIRSATATVQVDPTFFKVTTGDLVNDLGMCWMGVWGDYDGDG